VNRDGGSMRLYRSVSVGGRDGIASRDDPRACRQAVRGNVRNGSVGDIRAETLPQNNYPRCDSGEVASIATQSKELLRWQNRLAARVAEEKRLSRPQRGVCSRERPEGYRRATLLRAAFLRRKALLFVRKSASPRSPRSWFGLAGAPKLSNTRES
jgi:hypothetical protein